MLSRSSLIVVLLAATVACDKVPLGAPSGTVITVTSSTKTLPANGTTEITAFVSEASGTPVQNGTTVRFTTSLGSVDPPEAQTRNGAAVTMLRAGAVSGVAQVRATSGAGTGGAGTTLTNVVEISIGAAGAATLSLSASAATVPAGGGTVTLRAIVVDAAGNRVPGVLVTFTTTGGTLSNSTPVTDANGEATTTLTSNRTATVTARVGTGDAARTATATITAVSNAIGLTAAPAAPVVGQPVTLTVTPTIGAGNAAPRVSINWGDGTTEDLGFVNVPRNVSHIYTSAATFTIVATATTDGDVTTASVGVVVAPRPPLTASLVAEPAASVPGVGNNTKLTVTVTPAVGGADMVESVTWDFDDAGSSAVTTGLTTNHVYISNGIKRVTATVRTTDGRTAIARVEFIISGI